MYETLKEDYNDKYEYIFPEFNFDKNLFNDPRLGNVDIESNLKVHNYDTNKLASFFINEIDWSSRDFDHKSGIVSKIFGNIKNINYEAKNIEIFKEDPTSELYGAIGYLAKLNLEKNKEGLQNMFYHLNYLLDTLQVV